MICNTVDDLDKAWAFVKTSGAQISGPPEVLEAARKRILEETRNPFFRSGNKPNLQYWGIRESGEKFRNAIYCPHTRANKIKEFIAEGTGYDLEKCTDFGYSFI